MYEPDLVLNNLQCRMYHKTKPTQPSLKVVAFSKTKVPNFSKY